MRDIKIFLASSVELESDRKEFKILIGRKNKEWHHQGVFLDLILWEDFIEHMDKIRLQDRYNEKIRQCDIFVMLYHSKVGKYTAEEFEIAFLQFKATGKPLIFTYFKDSEAGKLSVLCKEDLLSLWSFNEKLEGLGHFPSVYRDIEDLKYKFDSQLVKLVNDGFIRFDSKPHKDDAKLQSVNKGKLIIMIVGGHQRGKITELLRTIEKVSSIKLIAPTTDCSTREYSPEFYGSSLPKEVVRFVSTKEFEKMIEDDKFIAYDYFIGRYFGIEKEIVNNVIINGNIPIFETALSIAKIVKEKYTNSIIIGIVSPHEYEVLDGCFISKNRADYYITEGQYTGEQKFLSFMNDICDHIVVNDDSGNAVSEIINIAYSSKIKT